MLFPIPIGYFVSIFLLISGVFNCLEYLNDKPVNCTRAVLLNGLAEAGWPIIAASVILLLIQLNQQMEKLRLVATVTPSARTAKPQKKKKHSTEAEYAEDEEQKVHKETPAPAPAVSLAGLVKPIQAHASMQPIVHTQSEAPVTPSPHMPTYPNSPIPGGGRVPQPTAAPGTTLQSADLPPRPEPIPTTRSTKRAPSKAEAETLNFFKVD